MRRNRFRSKSEVSIATCFAVILGSLEPVILGPIVATSAAEQKIGAPPEAMKMRLIGYNDLQGRSAYQPTVHRQGNRYIAYIGHHGGTPEVPKPLNPLTGQLEFNGTSIVDVTDPAHPQYLAHIPGTPGNYEEGGARMTRVRRPHAAQRRPQQDLSAPRIRRQKPSNLRRHGSRQTNADLAA